MNNPEFEPDIIKSIDKSGYSEKQTDLQLDKKGTVRQQVKQFNRLTQKSQAKQTNVVSFAKKEKKAAVIFER